MVQTGFVYNLYREKTDPVGVLKYSALEVRYWISATLQSLRMLVMGQLGLDVLSGPVGVVQVIGETYEETRDEGPLMTWLTMLNLTILLTANLGVMNLLPLPALDGGRLVFLLIEAVRGKTGEPGSRGNGAFRGDSPAVRTDDFCYNSGCNPLVLKGSRSDVRPICCYKITAGNPEKAAAGKYLRKRTKKGLMVRQNYRHTIYASYIGYIAQAIVNNLAPLLFLTFQTEYDISIEKISLLITVNFGIQLLVDVLSARYVDRIGYRAAIMAAHFFCAAGLIGLGTFPEILPDPYMGLVLAVGLYAVGGGLIEVLISPIVEACPTDDKSGNMSLLHSFYCWGQVGVVLLSTLYFQFAGIENWRILALLWALVPIVNFFYFSRVPINHLVEEGQAMPVKKWPA